MAVTCWPSTMPASPTFGRRPPGRKLPRKKQSRLRQATAARRMRRSSSHEPDPRRTVVYASPERAEDSIGKMNGAPDADIAVFTEALRLPAEERDRYLDKACKGDVEFRRRVEALLLAYEHAGNFLKRPAGERPIKAVQAFPAVEKPGDRIGHYKLLQQIGEGGCGVVYMAEQEAPVRRRVALKIIKLGMDTKSVIARFEAERQALALMDHPNIARSEE